MPKITIDGHEVEVPAGATVIQAAELAGVEIPHFCYHNRLKIAGNCRMCLVEIEGAPKPVASCAWPIADNMVVHTTTEKVQKAREGVMEFLLINHPLDCPICDQGGECDLQDQAMAYGRDHSRYEQNKRAVPEKNMGPLIKTYMTRCIHCTRCVRFATDVAGVPELGAINRGEKMEISTYLNKALHSELSGNVIDLCPVGALTSKPYAFRGRPWELTKTETIDVMDAVGSNIRVDTYGPKVVRILPRLHEEVNEEWISDKTRFACDGLTQQRLDRPYIRVQGKLHPCTWEDAFTAIKTKLKHTKPEKIAAIAGDMADVESMLVLKNIMSSLGSGHMDCRQDGAAYDTSERSHYLFNTTIAGIEQADACLIIGAHPRFDAPIINARLHKRAMAGGFPVGYIGGSFHAEQDLAYAYEHLGDSPSVIADLISGKHSFAKVLKKAERPMIIIGTEITTRRDALSLQAQIATLAETYGVVDKAGEWNGFNVLHTAASRVGGLDVGFIPQSKSDYDTKAIKEAAASGDIEAVYLLGADEIDMTPFENCFVVYQGHHGDRGAHHADVILPGATYTEKRATYVNTEGRVQMTQRATYPPGEAKEDWRILRALGDALSITLPYNSRDELHVKLVQTNPVFEHLDTVTKSTWTPFKNTGPISDSAIGVWSGNFYMTDPISRHSVTMAQCTEEFVDSPTLKVAQGGKSHA